MQPDERDITQRPCGGSSPSQECVGWISPWHARVRSKVRGWMKLRDAARDAVDALAEAILPPLPTDFPRAAETVHARFQATGDVRTMGQYLAYLKRAGVF